MTQQLKKDEMVYLQGKGLYRVNIPRVGQPSLKKIRKLEG